MLLCVAKLTFVTVRSDPSSATFLLVAKMSVVSVEKSILYFTLFQQDRRFRSLERLFFTIVNFCIFDILLTLLGLS